MRRLLVFITAVFLAVCSCGHDEPENKGNNEVKKDTLCPEDHLIDSLRKQYCMSALSYTVVKDFKIIHSGALGVYDRNLRRPVDTSSIYRIASASKSFTGAAAMQLVDEGKISLKDDIGTILGFEVRNPYYPDVPITLEMLLSHTSSLHGDEDGLGNSLSNLNPLRNSEDLIKTAFYDERPGTAYHYSNKGLTIAACVVEKVRGERFDNLINDHLLAPLGITNAGFNPTVLDPATFVMSYIYRSYSKEYFFQSSPWSSPSLKNYELGYNTDKLWPAGGMNISANNLANWMIMFMQYGKGTNGATVLSKESVERMLTLTENAGIYCITLRKYDNFLDGHTMYGHTGSKYGFKSFMVFDPVSGFGFTLMTSSINKDEFSLPDLVPVLYKLFINPDFTGTEITVPDDDDADDVL